MLPLMLQAPVEVVVARGGGVRRVVVWIDRGATRRRGGTEVALGDVVFGAAAIGCRERGRDVSLPAAAAVRCVVPRDSLDRRGFGECVAVVR